MAKVWKAFALLLVITALVWLSTLWRWQSAKIDPSGTDVAIQLVALPLALTMALWFTIASFGRLRKYAAAPIAPTAAPSATSVSAEPAVSSAENERTASFAVLAATALVGAGSDWQAAQASISSGDCKPKLDTELTDDDGLAVFTVRMPDVDASSLEEPLDELTARLASQRPTESSELELGADVKRSLALISQCLASLTESIDAQLPSLAPPPVQRGTAPSASAPAPVMTIRIAVPPRWPLPIQQLAREWIDGHFESTLIAGLSAAGQSPAMAKTVHAAVQLHVHAVADAEAFWAVLDQQLLQWQRDRQPGLLLAIAAESGLSESRVMEMSAANALFSGANPNGFVLGEGAGALLLASPTWHPPEIANKPIARIHRPSIRQRDKSADATGRISPVDATQTLTDALTASACEASAIEHLTSDCDHRASRKGEAYGALQELLPHLDPGTQVLLLGVGCGDIGIARLLACIALAATQVELTQTAGLVLGTFASFDRFAVALVPAAAAARTSAV